MVKPSARYAKARKFLRNLVDWERSVGLTFSDETMRLDLFREGLAAIGNPQNSYRVAIVGGTKGKGSTSSILASLLQNQGYKVGFFSSPHLISVRERIRVDGEIIPQEKFADVIETLSSQLRYFDDPGQSRTFFETLTAAGLLHFARERVDIAVLEVGLGGRLDATNVTDPAVSVITPISRDHLHVLGNTLELIAEEKAGIMRAGRPTVFGRQKPIVRRYLMKRAEERGVEPVLYGRDYQARFAGIDRAATRFHYRDSETRYDNLELSLLGRHQTWNAASAIAALRRLVPDATEEGIRAGCRAVSWPGRGEFLEDYPPIFLDGAHNGDSAKVLAELVMQLFDRKVVLLFAGSRGKEFHLIFHHLLPLAREVIVTQSSHPRTMAAEEVAQRLRRADRAIPMTVEADWRKALEAARSRQEGKHALLIAGSLYLAGDVRGTYFPDLAQEEVE